MKELQFILEKAFALRAANEPAALATVVRIGGSTYRRPGARMLIDLHGQHWGTISGGCLEGEVVQQALPLIEAKKAALVPFNLSEDDLVLGFGAGCNGIVHILIEPLLPDAQPNIIDALQRVTETRNPAVITTIIDAPKSQDSWLGRHAFTSVDDASFSLDASLQSACLQEAQALLEMDLEAPRTVHWHTREIGYQAAQVECLFEMVRPPVRLYILGDGHDVPPVVDAARLLGWEVVIVGRKPVDELQHHFPHATEHQFLMHPEEAGQKLAIDARCAALVVHHHFLRDQAALTSLLQTDMPYIGVLGPLERGQSLLQEIESAGTPLRDADRLRVFAPLGLDIGTETPEEIALSAIAEIQAVLNRRSGGYLRERTLPIHEARRRVDP